MATVQRPGWTPSIRGLVPRAVSDAFEYVRNTLTSFRTQQQAQNANFLVQSGTHVGNGSAGNVQAPALGTGAGPADSQTIVGFTKVTVNGETYYTPLFK